MFYVLDNEKIVLFNEDKKLIENTLLFTHQYQGLEIKETNKNIVVFENTFYFEDDETYLNLKKAKDKERISQTALTRADVFEALILARNLKKSDLRALIENDDALSDIERLLYLNRFDDALEFYRNHPAIDFIASKLNITEENMDNFFDTKDYKFLT